MLANSFKRKKWKVSTRWKVRGFYGSFFTWQFHQLHCSRLKKHTHMIWPQQGHSYVINSTQEWTAKLKLICPNIKITSFTIHQNLRLVGYFAEEGSVRGHAQDADSHEGHPPCGGAGRVWEQEPVEGRHAGPQVRRHWHGHQEQVLFGAQAAYRGSVQGRAQHTVEHQGNCSLNHLERPSIVITFIFFSKMNRNEVLLSNCNAFNSWWLYNQP